MGSAGGLSGSSEIQLLRIRKWAQAHEARCIAIDPASALVRPGNIMQAYSVVKRLVDWCKSNDITLLTTSLLDRATENDAHTPLHISTVADTWIHLEYRAESGERNRGLSILKSRGTAHSNQVWEMVLSADGVELADVYSAGGEVLMGTLRMERERAEALARSKAAREHRRYLARLEAESREFEQRLRALQESYQATERLDSDTDSLIRHRRRADRASDE